jgi:hypothetical protein
MDQSLFQAMIEWEARLFGFNPRDLHGQPFLKTDLDWLYTTVQKCFGPESATSLPPHHLEPDFWKKLAHHLYLTHRNGMGAIIQTILHFLEDIQKNDPSLSTWAFAACEVLKLQHRELERLLKIHQLLQEQTPVWNHRPHPTESLEEAIFLEGWANLQKGEELLRLEDTFRLISKDAQQNRGYFKAQGDNSVVLLQLSPVLLKLLNEGDRISMILVGSDPRRLSIQSSQGPLLEDE